MSNIVLLLLAEASSTADSFDNFCSGTFDVHESHVSSTGIT